MIILIAILIFAAVAVLLIGSLAETRAARALDRMERMRAATIAPGSPLAQELQRSLYQRVLRPALSRATGIVLSLTPSGAVDDARVKLERAGRPGGLNASSFMFLRTLSLLAGFGAAVVLLSLWHEGQALYRYAAAGLLVFIGSSMPQSMLDSAIRNRQRLITRSLPDIIDLLVVSAEAGTGLDGALAEVVRRKKGPMPDEFSRVLTEIRLGKRRREAWSDMAERCDVQDLTNLVAAIHQAEELGVSIANTLRAQSDALRVRRSMQIRTIAATLSTKMLFPMVFCIFPALFVVVLGPGMLSIFDALAGLGW